MLLAQAGGIVIFYMNLSGQVFYHCWFLNMCMAELVSHCIKSGCGHWANPPEIQEWVRRLLHELGFSLSVPSLVP